MKTGHKVYEIKSTCNLTSVTEIILLETSTDIFSLTVLRKPWWSKSYKKVFYMWGLSGAAKELLERLNEWLEVYKKPGGTDER